MNDHGIILIIGVIAAVTVVLLFCNAILKIDKKVRVLTHVLQGQQRQLHALQKAMYGEEQL